MKSEKNYPSCGRKKIDGKSVRRVGPNLAGGRSVYCEQRNGMLKSNKEEKRTSPRKRWGLDDVLFPSMTGTQQDKLIKN